MISYGILFLCAVLLFCFLSFLPHPRLLLQRRKFTRRESNPRPFHHDCCVELSPQPVDLLPRQPLSRYARVHTTPDTVVMSGCTQRRTQSLCQGAHNAGHSRYVRVHTMPDTVVMSGCTQCRTQSLCQGAHNRHSRYVRVHTTDTVVMSGCTQRTLNRYVSVHTTDTVVMSGYTQWTQSLCQGAHNGHSRYVRVHTMDTVVMSGCTQRTQPLCQCTHNGH